jgi:hypothetical protein
MAVMLGRVASLVVDAKHGLILLDFLAVVGIQDGGGRLVGAEHPFVVSDPLPTKVLMPAGVEAPHGLSPKLFRLAHVHLESSPLIRLAETRELRPKDKSAWGVAD